MMELYVVYEDYFDEGCSEPIAVFSSWLLAHQFVTKDENIDKYYDVRYVTLLLNKEPK